MIVAATTLITAGAAAWLLAALLGLADSRVVVRVTALVSALGGAAVLAGGSLVAIHGVRVARTLGGASVVGSLTLRLDPLACVFAALLGLVALATALYAPRYHRERPRVAGAVYACTFQLMLVASLAVLVAGNAVVFLVAWETMTVLGYVVILRHHRDAAVERAAFLFLALGEAGFALLIAAFALLATRTGTLDLGAMAERSSALSPTTRGVIFVLALVGFGFKAGLVPLHVWLPEAHPAAPADGSALLSGLVIKLGVFGIALFGFELVAAPPTWCGLVTMGAGAVSAVLGILYGLMERDLKRFLAFSSIENVGIVVTALGAGMTFRAYSQHALGTFLLLAGLYHAVNHGTAKALLFLEAGVVERASGTRDLDSLGGLIHRARASAAVSLVGTLALAGLPPLNGFVSEWLVFQGLFQGFRIPSHVTGILIVVAGAVLALTAGLAIMAFARAFGLAFLGAARTRQAAAATDQDQPVAGPAVLAAACIALAIGAPAVLAVLDRVARATTGVDIHAQLLVPKLTVIPGHTDFAGFSPTYLAAFLVAVVVVPVVIFKLRRPLAPTRRVPVWDGGIVTFRPRMQYTATTYANPVRVTFDELYRPERHVERASDDPAGRSGPVHYRFTVLPLFERYLYGPVVRTVEWLADLVRPIQSGDVNLYLLYVFVVVLIAYLVYAF